MHLQNSSQRDLRNEPLRSSGDLDLQLESTPSRTPNLSHLTNNIPSGPRRPGGDDGSWAHCTGLLVVLVPLTTVRKPTQGPTDCAAGGDYCCKNRERCEVEIGQEELTNTEPHEERRESANHLRAVVVSHTEIPPRAQGPQRT